MTIMFPECLCVCEKENYCHFDSNSRETRKVRESARKEKRVCLIKRVGPRIGLRGNLCTGRRVTFFRPWDSLPFDSQLDVLCPRL